MGPYSILWVQFVAHPYIEKNFSTKYVKHNDCKCFWHTKFRVDGGEFIFFFFISFIMWELFSKHLCTRWCHPRIYQLDINLNITIRYNNSSCSYRNGYFIFFFSSLCSFFGELITKLFLKCEIFIAVVSNTANFIEIMWNTLYDFYLSSFDCSFIFCCWKKKYIKKKSCKSFWYAYHLAYWNRELSCKPHTFSSCSPNACCWLFAKHPSKMSKQKKLLKFTLV